MKSVVDKILSGESIRSALNESEDGLYAVEIRQITSKVVSVHASSKEEAIRKVAHAVENEDRIPMDDDSCNYDVNYFPIDVDDFSNIPSAD